ncbi:WD40-repeat-containing domain protein [Lentinula raphanica]|nr:WD40-repeat-containing domain protein [Lentinula raphanica]
MFGMRSFHKTLQVTRPIFWLPLAQPMKPSYTQLGTIDAPTDYVHALAFSTNGRYLASATNDNKLRVYNVQRSFMTVWEEETHHPCTVVVWRENALFVGSMDGNVLCCYPSKNWLLFQRKSDLIYKTDDAIHAIEFNQRGDFLLVCAGADVFLFEKRVYFVVVKDLMNSSLTYRAVSGRWAYRDYLPRPDPFGEYDDGDIYPIIATGAHFLDDANQCLIGYLYNGFWRFSLEKWESINVWGPDYSFDSKDPRRHYGRIAASAKSPDSKSIVATDACLGLQWFKVTSERLKSMSTTYHPQNLASNIPLPVLFINQGAAVIVGSTTGCALIMDTKRAERIQALKHGNDRTWVTALAYVEPTGCSRMIATGDGNRGKQTRIVVWVEDQKGRSSRFVKLWGITRKISIHFLTLMRISFILMGIISTLSWLCPAQWREVIGLGSLLGNVSGYTLNLMPEIPRSTSTAIPTPTSTPLKTKAKEFIDTFGELMVEDGD